MKLLLKNQKLDCCRKSQVKHINKHEKNLEMQQYITGNKTNDNVEITIKFKQTKASECVKLVSHDIIVTTIYFCLQIMMVAAVI